MHIFQSNYYLTEPAYNITDRAQLLFNRNVCYSENNNKIHKTPVVAKKKFEGLAEVICINLQSISIKG